MARLDGKVALISGAARGQGAAEARLVVSEGARVVIGDVLDAKAAEVAAELGDAEVDLHLDVTSEDNWGRAVDLARERFGGLQVLVCNAGISPVPSPITETSLDAYRRVVDVNKVGTFLGLRARSQRSSTAAEGRSSPSPPSAASRVSRAWRRTRRRNGPCAAVPDYAALATGPGALITGIQLNDAPRQPGPDLMVQSKESRLLPGEGECDLIRLMATLDEIGAVAPRGVEVFSAALRELDPLEVAHRAGDAVRAAIRAAQEEAGTRGS